MKYPAKAIDLLAGVNPETIDRWMRRHPVADAAMDQRRTTFGWQTVEMAILR